MAQFKCKMCGGQIEIDSSQATYTCEYCGTLQTVPKVIDNNRLLALHNRANAFRLKNEFDKALTTYETIVSESPEDAEAHWGIVLCRYGIEYVDDIKTGKKIPTCHRTQAKSIFDDVDYLAAIDNADVIAADLYKKEAEVINNLQKQILAISSAEKPYDVFICYKETDENGKRTRDSIICQEIYDELTKRNYKVFFSKVSLESKLGTQYEPYIYAALTSAKVMLVVGTKLEYFNAPWVKNEWSRFLSFMQTQHNKYIIPCYKDLDPYDLPDELLEYQSQDMNKLGFIQDLIRGIEKLCKQDEYKRKEEQKEVIVQTATKYDSILKRSEILIADGEFDKAAKLLDNLLNNEPENAKAYALLAVIDYNLSKESDLALLLEPLMNNKHFKRAYEFASGEYKELLDNYYKTSQYYISCEKKYNEALRELRVLNYVGAREIFLTIEDYKDTKKHLEICNSAIEKKYIRGCTLFDNKDYWNAYQTFNLIGDYKDAIEKTQLALSTYKTTQYEAACGWMNRGDYARAINVFRTIIDYKDSRALSEEASNLLQQQEELNRKKSIKRNIIILAVIVFLIVGIVLVSVLVGRNKNSSKNSNSNSTSSSQEEGTSIVDKSTGLTVTYFGKYPQTYVSDTSTINKLNNLSQRNSNGYYEYNGEEYINVVAKPYASGVKFSNGTTIQANASYWFKVEPIKWIVLEATEANKKLLSDKLLDVYQFHNSTNLRSDDYGKTISPNNYTNSNIRKWLTVNFYGDAFDTDHRKKILAHYVNNSASTTGSTSNSYACGSTTDFVFLLSYSEAFNNYTSIMYKIRDASPTDYALARGAYYDASTAKRGTWWLRSPADDTPYQAGYVNSTGQKYNKAVTSSGTCIRPSIYIKNDQ